MACNRCTNKPQTKGPHLNMVRALCCVRCMCLILVTLQQMDTNSADAHGLHTSQLVGRGSAVSVGVSSTQGISGTWGMVAS